MMTFYSFLIYNCQKYVSLHTLFNQYYFTRIIKHFIISTSHLDMYTECILGHKTLPYVAFSMNQNQDQLSQKLPPAWRL